MNFESGEVIILENKEYICVANAEYENESYIFLMSNFKPTEIKFAKKIPNEYDIQLEIINNKKEKEILLQLFSKYITE